LVLGLYSAAGLEAALEHYGLLAELGRLGYGPFRVEIAHSPSEVGGDRIRVFGAAARAPESGGDGSAAAAKSGAPEHLLVEVVLEKQHLDGAPVLYVHWLTMRHPRARFSALRPRLPGQEVPGLGLAREVTELLRRMAARLELEGVAFRPANYHTALSGRVQELRFIEPKRQGRFEALARDLAQLPLLEATCAVDQGRVRMNGAPYRWEPDEMVRWLKARPVDEEAIRAERERVKFTLDPTSEPPTP
jgi:hypothetical protein